MKLLPLGFYWLLTSSWFQFACSDLTLEKEFNVNMYAVRSAPSDASGDMTPLWLQYTLTRVALTSATTGNEVVLLDDATAEAVRIVNREQVIFSQPISDFTEKQFTQAAFTFNATVIGANSEREDLSFAMANTTLTYSGAILLEDSSDTSISIVLSWLNIISGTTLQEPSYTLSED